MAKPRLLAGNTVLVLTSDWMSGVYLIRYFPDQACIDSSNYLRTIRSRLSNAVSVGTRNDCESGAPFQVTRCNVN